MSRILPVLLIALLSLLVHLTLGWQVTLMAGVVAGLWRVRRGWLIGAAGVGLAWAGLVGYNLAVAPEPTGELFRVMGGLLGPVPAPVIPLVTLALGLFLGAVGGGIGTQVARLAGRSAR